MSVPFALWAAQADSGGDQAALYGAVALVLTSLIGGGFAYLSSRSKPAEPPAVRYLDPPTSNSLPHELSELLADALEGERTQRQAASVWEQRARALGWKDGP